MIRPAKSVPDLLLLPLLLFAGSLLWLLHAQSWDLGGRSPVLNYDAAQYALAGRELAWHGRFATPFGLPIDLVHQARPPWPLAAVQPGLVLFEALVFKLVPARGAVAGSDPRAWLTLLLPFCSFLFLGAALALSVRYVFARWWPDAPASVRLGAALVLGLAFFLDPEAQHFAVSGLTEMPFTVGLLFLLLGLALGVPGERPFVFGLVMGVAGLFRANMLWLAPVFALAGAWSAEPGRRWRVLPLALLGYALPLAPWWLYKWFSFGSPSWDLTRFVIWDGVQGRGWFSLYHLPQVPEVPHGIDAVRLLAAKVGANLPKLGAVMLLGPRGLWFGGIAGWLLLRRPPRPLAAAGAVALAAAGLGVLTAAVSIPWLRYVFPTRILAEAAGVLALGALITHLTRESLREPARRLVFAAIAVLALAWGALSTVRGNREAVETAKVRGEPPTRTMTALSIAMNARLTPGEVVMCNLGPTLAWHSLHPVLHLAFTPADVPACRRYLDFDTILLVVREGRRAWPGWDEVVEQPGFAATIPGLNVAREERVRTPDGFVVVWLSLGPREPALALRAAR